MVAYLLDHLWQSILFSAMAACLAWLTRKSRAAVRLWIWRIAALKFLVPLDVLLALGAWIGFPVKHNAVPPPALLAIAAGFASRAFTPARSVSLTWAVIAVATVAAILTAAACVLAVLRKEREARAVLDAEDALAANDLSARPPPPGFFKAAALTGCAVGVITLPVLFGGVEGRLRRQEVLAIDTRALRSARITMTETPHTIGEPPRVTAARDGIVIHDTNLQDLVALVYGIGHFEIFGGALPFLESPHYDVRIDGPVSAPAMFDGYALREPVTRYLYARFGVSIRVNGGCQAPCTNQESFVIERLR